MNQYDYEYILTRNAALYGIPKGTKKNPDNKMGIFQSLGQHYTQYDLDKFFYSFTR